MIDTTEGKRLLEKAQERNPTTWEHLGGRTIRTRPAGCDTTPLWSTEDAEAVVWLRNNAPALIEEVERLRRMHEVTSKACCAEQERRAKAEAERDALRATVERLTGELATAKQNVTDCRTVIESMIDVYHDEHEGLSEYFEMHGPQHSQEDCPEDDTCDCPEAKKLHAAWKRWGREISDAYTLLRALSSAKPPTDGAGKDNK